MYELYGFSKGDRSGRVAWLLDEVGHSYQRKDVSFQNGDLEKPEYLALNPMGMVPTLVESGKPMMESCSILLYLAEKHSDKKQLMPPPGSPHRQAFLQWHFFAAATFDHRFNDLMMLLYGPGNDEDTKKKNSPPIIADLKYMAAIVERELGDKDYLVGGEFSIADISVGTLCTWLVDDFLPKAEFPRIHRYVERLKARPAVKASGALE